jgi:hypothetical protein
MFRKEVNERSPMRVFERSLHGGLGRGNVGVVVARAGVGKTGLLVHIALDDLMRGRKVLHISHEHAVDRVRSYYDEIFHDIAITHRLAQAQLVRLDMERNRLICSHLSTDTEPPVSLRGGSSSIAKIEQTLSFALDVAHFQPDTVIIDGFDFEGATDAAVATLTKAAASHDAELWLSAKTAERIMTAPPSSASASAVPREIRRFFDKLAVIVLLRPDGEDILLELLKEHDNPDLSDLCLHLDPCTMRVLDEDLKQLPRPAKDPARFHLFSGGARGAECEFGRCAEAWGLEETHFSFESHPFLERERGVQVLDDEELKKGDFSLLYASHRLGRPLSQIPNIKRILQTTWHQITAAGEVFVIGSLQPSGTVRGGTGWGAELARLWGKPICVFDQERGAWFRWDATRWREEAAPVIEQRDFAGLGTTNLTGEGRDAIRKLYERTFGPPKTA